MNFEQFSKPLLIEPGIKYYLTETLKQCSNFKSQYNNLLFNIGICILFVLR